MKEMGDQSNDRSSEMEEFGNRQSEIDKLREMEEFRNGDQSNDRSSEIEEFRNRQSEIDKLRKMEEFGNVLEDGLDELLINAVIEYEKIQQECKEECKKEENKKENKKRKEDDDDIRKNKKNKKNKL
ncbi:hypothetical protein RF55_23800 [Lasius niger]|uniref:Uncharacterized protein n=1 Tax=Lasius niger TaxID=67767 RepID=A0A0J7JVF3_LASNI|nr:hypothetical protein RF55_23800 [Lasius niger]